jgi:hypothetical protein
VYSESYNVELAESFENIGSGEMKVVSNIFKSKLKDCVWGAPGQCVNLAGWFPFPYSVVEVVLRVHNSVFAVVCVGCDADHEFGGGRVFFVSVADMKILRVITSDVCCFRPDRHLCFAPGEIWMLGSSKPFLTYYGPHESRNRSHDVSERMVQGMYGEICKGNAQNAVDQLTALGLDICTARSPFNEDSLAEVVVKIAEDASVFSSLLAIEPQIVTMACLKTVVMLKRYDILAIILQDGGDVDVMKRVDERCLSLLHLAVEKKKIGHQLTGLLVSARMDVPALDAIDPFLAHIPKDMSPSIVAILCEAGARVDVNVRGCVPVLHHWMSLPDGGYHRHIGILVSFGYDIDRRDHAGRTPLMVAALSNHVRNVRALLSKGASINARDNSGRTAADLLLSATPRGLRVHVREVLGFLV